MLTSYKKIDDENDKYELTNNVRFTIPQDKIFRSFSEYLEKKPLNHRFFNTHKGSLNLLYGYRSDGASGPTWDTPNSFGGAYLHDCLYQSLRLGLIPQHFKPVIDLWFYLKLRRDGMSYIRAKVWYWGVVHFGAGSSALL